MLAQFDAMIKNGDELAKSMRAEQRFTTAKRGLYRYLGAAGEHHRRDPDKPLTSRDTSA
jgi:hypothetical protein